MNRRSLVLVEDDAGDALLVTEMLLDVAPDVTLTCFTTLQAALDDWPADADCVAARPRPARRGRSHGAGEAARARSPTCRSSC